MTLPPGSPPIQLPGCTPLPLWAPPALAPVPICRPYAHDSVLLPLQGQHGSSTKQPVPEQSGHWHLPSSKLRSQRREGWGRGGTEGGSSGLATSWTSTLADVPSSQCGYCPRWPRELAQWGLCPFPSRLSWLAWWHPTRQLGGEIRHFLSPLHMLGRWGEGTLRQAPICVP